MKLEEEIPVDAFNAYCWIHSTYFVTGAMLGVAGVNVAFPGVASSSSFLWPHNRVGHLSFPENHNRKEEEIKVIRYYQWVAFLLLLQVLNSNFIINYYYCYFGERLLDQRRDLSLSLGTYRSVTGNTGICDRFKNFILFRFL
ncbi:hypothetical protein G9C98_007594 [Cotesia typhae]|uniref:Innexin n=1 Tax=Cotesia typhae TaxID=2053667 RepID=A0A8J5V6M2_9HYME|nr:hypothetical protein G9C98_007594 [Cotesia typhae]